jgi:hypothetical protein
MRGAPVTERRNPLAPMLLEALSALMLASAAQAPRPQQPPPPPIEDRPVAALLLALRGHCPPVEPRIRSAGPEALMRLETGFRDKLAAPNRSRLDQTRRSGGARCAAGDASCQAHAGLSAILDSGQMGAFALYVCAQAAAAAAAASAPGRRRPA